MAHVSPSAESQRPQPAPNAANDGQPYPAQPGHPPQPGSGYPPQQGYPPQGYPQQGYPQQGYPPQGYPAPPGYPPPPAGYPPQPGPPPGYPPAPQPPPRPPQRPGQPATGGVPAQPSAPPGYEPVDPGSQYPYPYTGGFSAVTHESDAKRPGTMQLALVLLVFSVLPGIVLGALGLVALIVAPNGASIQAAVDGLASQYGTSAELAVTIARIAAGTVIVLGLLFLLVSVLAWRGRNWARVLVTVMTGLFAAVVVLGLAGGGSAQGGLAVVIVVTVLAVGGVVLLYLPRSAAYYKAKAKG